MLKNSFLTVILVSDNIQEKWIQSFVDQFTLDSELEIIQVCGSADGSVFNTLQNHYANSEVVNFQLIEEKSYGWIEERVLEPLSQSLGDFVAVINPDVTSAELVLKLTQQVFDEDLEILFFDYRRSSWQRLKELLGAILLKRVSGKPAFQYSEERIVSRSYINGLLSSFPPVVEYVTNIRGNGLKQRLVKVDHVRPSRRYSVWSNLLRWMRVLVYSGSRPMRLVSFTLLIGMLFNLTYSLYVLLVWRFKDDVMEGWVSESLQSSISQFLIALALFVLSEYILYIHEIIKPSIRLVNRRNFRSNIRSFNETLNVLENEE